MSDAERELFLTQQRTCRAATSGRHGPHATALWFLWQDGHVWIHSLTRSQRWVDLMADPRIGLVVDAGEDYGELRGVEITGRVVQVGEIPRTGEPNPELDAVEQAFAAKYSGGAPMNYDGRHAWLRLDPAKIVSWDFRKIPAGSNSVTSG